MEDRWTIQAHDYLLFLPNSGPGGVLSNPAYRFRGSLRPRKRLPEPDRSQGSDLYDVTFPIQAGGLPEEGRRRILPPSAARSPDSPHKNPPCPSSRPSAPPNP